MSSLPNSPEPTGQEDIYSGEEPSLELLLTGQWETPLWKRLLGEVRDFVAPEKLPPLRLTSKPVDVGMLPSDRLGLPWFRTIFSSIGDVISPETLPPLELESRPEDIGELISDQMSHMWWSSLLRNLADTFVPERQPALQLTAAPMDLPGTNGAMLLPRWSSTISTPKIFYPDRPKTEFVLAPVRAASPKPKPDEAEIEFIHVLQADLKRDLRRSVFRQRLWVSLAVLEVVALIGSAIWWK
jgi:hypothetical protein